MPVCCNMFLPMLCIPDRHVGNQCDGIMRHFPAGKFPPVCRNVKYRSMILRADPAGHFSVEKMREKRYNKNAY